MVEEQQHYKSRTHYEQQQHKRRYFQSVIDGYLRFIETSSVVAINYDPFVRTTKRTPIVSHFLADVELATRRVLSPELYGKWFDLIQEKEVEPAIAKRIVNVCARIYMQRELAPFRYFKRLKQA